MKAKIEKGLRYLAAGIFFVALLLNVKFTLDSPYFLTGNELVAQTTGTGTETTTEESSLPPLNKWAGNEYQCPPGSDLTLGRTCIRVSSGSDNCFVILCH